MELRQLTAFVAIVRAGNFTRAARSLGVAQPALSQRLRALELELGAVLIDRGNRTAGLTDAGRHLLPRAERILAEAHDAAEELAAHAGRAAGTVRLGCALQTLLEGELAQVLARFAADHPGVRLAVTELHTEQVLASLGRGELDLGLVHLGRAGDAAPIGAEAARASLAVRRLYKEPLVVIVARGHRLARRAGVALEDLAGEPHVTFQPGSTIRQLVLAAAAARGVELRIAFSSANLGTVRAMVAAGLGVAIVPRSAAAVPWPHLAAVPLTAPRLERIVTLIRDPARFEGPAVATLRARLADELARSASPRRRARLAR